MDEIIKNTKYDTRPYKRFSTFILTLIFILLPFDSYLGEMISLPIVPILLVLFIFIKVTYYIFDQNPFEFTPILFYICYGIIMTLFGLVKVGISYNFLLYYFNIAFFFCVISETYSKEEIKKFIKTAPISLFIFIFICLLHTKVNGNTIYMAIRDITDPNYLITGLVLVIAMHMFLIMREQHALKKLFLILELMITFGFIILIGSRGGLLACLFTAFLAIMFGSKHPIKMFVIACIIFVFGAMLAFSFLPQDLLDRFDINNIIHSTGSGRLTIWSNYMNLYINADIFTIIFGFGRDYIPTIYYELFGKTGYYPHNLYVKTIAESGIIGFGIFIIMNLWILKSLFQSKNGLILSAYLGLMLGSVFLDMDNMRIFWLVLIFVALNNRSNQIYMWRGKNEVFDNSSDI